MFLKKLYFLTLLSAIPLLGMGSSTNLNEILPSMLNLLSSRAAQTSSSSAAGDVAEGGLFRGLDTAIAGGISRGMSNPGFVNGLTKALADAFQGEGHGRRVIANILGSFENEFKADGQGHRLLARVGESITRLWESGGEFDQALQATSGSINRFMAKSGLFAVPILIVLTTSYYGTKFAWRMIERNYVRPKLIISSSKLGLWGRLKKPFVKKQESARMVFNPEITQRLDDIVKATRNIQKKIKEGKTNVKYRNLMLYGAPGTGKTMFAKRLAQESGLEWAYMSGSSFSKFENGAGIEALDELFTWAQKSKGLMIFIDEAESFLATRENMDPTSKAYQLLNNFLNYTGERSNRFMIVFATNHKNNLDSSMYRRIDDLIELPLPQASERVGVLKLYRDKILGDVRQNGQAFVNSATVVLSDEKIAEMSVQTEGLSNGDLEGIINTIKTDADITDSGLLTSELVDRVVQRAIEKHLSFNAHTAVAAVTA